MTVMLCISLPFTMLLSGCGATPTNDVNAVYFESDKYDSDGKAIFEVDLNVTKYLTFKVNPSSWSGYAVTYSNDATQENRRYFELIEGTIKVIDMRFQQIVVGISIKEHTDYCIVRLKEYPTKFYSEKTNIDIAAQGMFTIDPIAEFSLGDGSTDIRHVTEKDFNFKVESSDETKIHVPDSSRLKIYAVCTNSATATVKVTLLDTSGNEKAYFELNVNVIQSAKRAVLKIDGEDKFIKSGDTINVSTSKFTGDTYSIGYNIYFFSGTGILLDGNSQISCSFNDNSVISANLDENLIVISTSVRVGTTFDVKMLSKVTDDNGSPIQIAFKIAITN